MNVKNTVLKMGLISLLAFGANLQAAEQPLRLGIEAAYPPFASKTPDNTIVGFDYDIGQALCAEMKVQCVWQEQEFDGLIPALKFKKGSGISEIPAQLKGKRIGVQRATNFDRYVTEKFAPAGAEVVRYGSQNEIFLDLLGGRLDATMASSVVIDESLLKRPEGQDFEFVGPNFTEEQFFGSGIGIAVRKNDPLAGRFNQALATIRANGTYDTIRQKYFDFDIYGE